MNKGAKENYYTDPKELICLKCELPDCDEDNPECLYHKQLKTENRLTTRRRWYKKKKAEDPEWYKQRKKIALQNYHKKKHDPMWYKRHKEIALKCYYKKKEATV